MRESIQGTKTKSVQHINNAGIKIIRYISVIKTYQTGKTKKDPYGYL